MGCNKCNGGNKDKRTCSDFKKNCDCGVKTSKLVAVDLPASAFALGATSGTFLTFTATPTGLGPFNHLLSQSQLVTATITNNTLIGQPTISTGPAFGAALTSGQYANTVSVTIDTSLSGTYPGLSNLFSGTALTANVVLYVTPSY